MRMVDLIEKKKQGYEHTLEEIHYIIQGYVQGDIPDYQISAWLMAICFQGLNLTETVMLTKEMMESGDILDLSSIQGIKVDKHSTGGVGDKTSLVLGPMVASCGVPVAKMSGRGLGHTGGTLDKLEAIPGFHIHLSHENFIQQVNDCHFAIIGQDKNLVPADQLLYALRDVTATVSSMPLIASSIMSKKLAAGCDAILLDVKYGHGAFMKTKEEAIELAHMMIEIGKSFHKDTRATISNMSQPLGYAIGNSLEVIEAINTLQGNGPDDLKELCLQSGTQMLLQANITNSAKEARQMLEKSIEDHSAYHVLLKMIKAQGGKTEYIQNPELFSKAQYIVPVFSLEEGYIHDIQAQSLGIVSMKLGGGRQVKDDIIDYSVGLVLKKKVGDYVHKKEPLLYIHANEPLSKELENDIIQAYIIKKEFIEKPLCVEEII